MSWSGCGFATGGAVAAASSGGGGAANAPATPAGLVVLAPETSPATIRIVMTDAESDAAEVEFFYAVAGEERVVERIATNPVRLATSRAGKEHLIPWDFAAEAGIGTTTLTQNVTLLAKVRSGVDQSTVVALGNDAPAIAPDPVVAAEVSGVVPLPFAVADSSADITAVKVEYRIEGGTPDDWRIARPAGLAATQPTPNLAFTRIEAAVAPGTRQVFFWDSVHDLAGLERDVVLRFTPSDPFATGTSVEVGSVRVDNNQRPIVQVDDGALTASGDRRRGVSVPFTVFDEESDRVDLILQWRSTLDAAFEDLGTNDPVQLRRLLKDENFLRDKRICRAGRLAAAGEGQLLDARRMRTEDLALDQAWALPHGLVGRPIEFLRPIAEAPTVVSGAWAANPLVRPVAVLPIDSGVEALVLDDIGGSATVVVVDVVTGVVVKQLAAGLAGAPTAMCWSKRRSSVLVATQASSGWLVHEVSLDGGAVQVATANGAPTTAAIRGLVAHGDQVVLATAANKLLRIDWIDPVAPRSFTLLDNLSEPWGVVLDPLDHQRVFLAERSFGTVSNPGRIAAWDLNTRLPVAFLPLASAPVRPSAMALEPLGRRLYVVSEPLGGGRQIRRFEWNTAGQAAAFPIVAVSAGVSAVGAGALGVWFAIDPPARAMSVQGGASHRRTVTSYDPATMTMTLDADLVGVGPRVAWRVALASGRSVATAPGGRKETFLWDTSDVVGVGGVVLRAIAMDSDVGLFDETSAGVTLLPDATETQVLAGSGAIEVVADLDADGDVDVKTGTLVQTQTQPRAFAAGPVVSQLATMAFDANGDGRNDLVELGSQVRIWNQTASGGFPAVGSPSRVIGIAASQLADLDGDGRFDLVGPAGAAYQNASGTFTTPTSVNGQVFRDMNADGRLDAVARAGAVVTVSLQAANRTFASAYSLNVLRPLAGSNALFVEDVDGDGHMDVIAPGEASFFGTAVLLVKYQGPLSVFSAEFRSDSAGAGYALGEVGDLDGDGLVDFQGSTVLRQTAPRRFASGSVAGAVTSRLDVDGDGAPDDVVGASVAFAVPRGGFTQEVLTAANSLGSGRDFEVADVDGDMALDIAVARSSTGSQQGSVSSVAQVFRQESGAVFSPDPNLAFAVSLTGDMPPSHRLGAGDLNGDGVTDVLWQTLDPNSGGTAFRLVSRLGPTDLGVGGLSVSAVATLGDIDGDGRMDLVHDSNDRVRVRRQQAGGFPLLQEFDPIPGDTTLVNHLALGDWNGDARVDLLVGISSQVRVHLQTSTGLFAETAAVVATGSFARIVDLDGDGIRDFVANNGGLRAAYGTGPGQFGAPQVVAPGIGAFAIVDLDADGDLDVMGSNGQILAFSQVAPRNFVLVRTAGSVTGKVRFEDMDNDGEIDIAASGVRLLFGGR